MRLRQSQDKEAWDRFVALYTPFVIHLLVNRLHVPSQDVADLVQDIFVALLQALPKFDYDRKPGHFRCYLCQVCRSRVCDWQRKQRIAARNGTLLGVEEDDTDELEKAWEAEHNQFLVRRALEVMQAEFQPTTWRACWEFVVNGRSAADVAGELGISENAVFIARHRVIHRLQAELEGLLDG